MLAIIVPYRDRKSHLDQFIPHMNKYLPDAKVVIVEQEDDKPFNRGRLLNVGFLEINPLCFVAHDIDMLPSKVDYSSWLGITQLADSNIQQTSYLGGVTMFDAFAFRLAGGYHNDFFHRAEDNELMFHLQRRGLGVNYRVGIFTNLPHPRTGPEFIPELWQKAQLPRTKNMLKTCEYQLISKEVFDSYIHLKVSL